MFSYIIDCSSTVIHLPHYETGPRRYIDVNNAAVVLGTWGFCTNEHWQLFYFSEQPSRPYEKYGTAHTKGLPSELDIYYSIVRQTDKEAKQKPDAVIN